MEENIQSGEMQQQPAELNIPEKGFKNSLIWFLRRGAALIIDNVLVTVAVFILYTVLGLFFNLDIAFRENAVTNTTLLLYTIYYVFMLGKYQYTLGKKWLGIKVVKDDGTKFGYFRAFFRFLGTTLSGLIFGLGYIVMFFNPRRKTLHDYIVGTVVVLNK